MSTLTSRCLAILAFLSVAIPARAMHHQGAGHLGTMTFSGVIVPSSDLTLSDDANIISIAYAEHNNPLHVLGPAVIVSAEVNEGEVLVLAQR